MRMARRQRAIADAMTALFLIAVVGAPSSRAEPTAAEDPDRIVASGQTTGYFGNAGALIDGNGDDGDLVRGRLPRFAEPSARTPTTQAENVVVDENTGLMWVRSPSLLDAMNEQGVHGNVRLDLIRSWQGGIDAANELVYAGFSDWRLPNVNELQTIVDFSRHLPALDPAAFPESYGVFASPYFWSSTTNDASPFEAFYVNFFDGHAYPWHKAVQFAARPVRLDAVVDPVPVFQTGQRRGYRGDLGGEGGGNGDDGNLQRGQSPNYSWSDDGLVDTQAENVAVDVTTDLMWVRDPLELTGEGGAGAVGGNVDMSLPSDWQSAISACNLLEYAGYDDWRLPHIRELVSITQPGRPGSSVDPATFPNAPIAPTAPELPWFWWSSTTAAVGREDQPAGSEAWYIATGPPFMRHHIKPESSPAKSAPGYARCVRDLNPLPAPDLYREEVRSSADWAAISLAVGRGGVTRVGKYLIPVHDAGAAPDPSAPFRVAFQDVNQHALHYDFLRAAFPDLYATLTVAEYSAMVSPRATRSHLAGSIREFTGAGGARTYGFDVTIDSDDAPDLLSQAETAALHRRVAQRFRRRPLVYSPMQPGAIAEANRWITATFPIDYPSLPPDTDFEAYTTGDAYGVLRLLTLPQLAQVEADGLLSFQDIVVLDRTPTDVQSVVAGILTGDRQGELSHLAVRSARRGTPSAFVAGAHTAFAPHADQLVRVTVTHDGYSVKTGIPRAEAEAWWAGRRPPPVPSRRWMRSTTNSPISRP